MFISFTLPHQTGLTAMASKFGHFLSVNLSQPRSPPLFTEIFRRQLVTLQRIEEEDALDDSVHDQVCNLLSLKRMLLRLSKPVGWTARTMEDVKRAVGVQSL